MSVMDIILGCAKYSSLAGTVGSGVAGGGGTAIEPIDDSRAVLMNGASVKVVSVSGTTVSFGSPSTLTGAAPNVARNCLVKLDSTRMFAAWADSNYSNVLRGCVLTITGTSISVGAISTVKNVNTGIHVSGTLLSTDTVLIIAKGAPTTEYLESYVVTLSGDTPTAGTLVTNTGIPNVASTNIKTLTSTTALYCCAGGGKIAYGVISVSGATVTFSSAYVDTVAGDKQTMVMAAANKGLVCYGRGTGTPTNLCVLSVSGTSVTLETAVQLFGTSSLYSAQLMRLKDDKALLVFSTSAWTKYSVITVAGTVPSGTTAVQLSASTYQNVIGCALNSAGGERGVYNIATTAYAII